MYANFDITAKENTQLNVLDSYMDKTTSVYR